MFKYFSGLIFFALFMTNTAIAETVVPNVFSSGQVVSASQMNQNFTALANGVNSKISNVYLVQRYSTFAPS